MNPKLHINEFFDKVLDVALKNPRAWGGRSRAVRNIVLRTWDRETCERGDGITWRRVLRPSTCLNSAGRLRAHYSERYEHLLEIESGVPGFMVTVTEFDKPHAGDGRIKEFNQRELIPIGRLDTDCNGDVWAECLPPVTVATFKAGPKT